MRKEYVIGGAVALGALWAWRNVVSPRMGRK